MNSLVFALLLALKTDNNPAGECYSQADQPVAICLTANTVCISVFKSVQDHIKNGRMIQNKRGIIRVVGSREHVTEFSDDYNLSTYDGLNWYIGEC